jgi:hypothetical protein
MSERVAKAISKSPVFVCLIDSDYVNSSACVSELIFAKQANKVIIPLMYENLAPAQLGAVSHLLSGISRILVFLHLSIYGHAIEWRGRICDQLVAVIERGLGKVSVSDPFI